jgi:hypothetical protein
MAKPSTLPEWDTNETNVTEADTSHKDDGWTVTAGIPEKPPVEYDNWYKNLTYKWIDYLADSSLPIGSLIEHYGVNPDTTLYAESGDIISTAANPAINKTLLPVLSLTQKTPGSSFTNVFYNHAYGLGLHIICGTAGEIQSSPDTNTWTRRLSGLSYLFAAAAFGDDIFTVGGQGGLLYYSTDGTSFSVAGTNPLSSSDVVNDIIYVDSLSLFVGAVFDTSGSSGKVVTSSDGDIWSLAATTAEGLQGIGTDGTNIIIVGANGFIATSTNATSWTTRTPAGGYSNTFNEVAFGDDFALAVGNSGEIQLTYDNGATWAQKTAAGSYSGNFQGVNYNDGYFVLVGLSAEIQVTVSGDYYEQRSSAGSYSGGFTSSGYGDDKTIILGDTAEIEVSNSTDREVPTFSTAQAGFTQYMKIA